eukprot:scaffold34710_cov66-Skeletonema_marinoi.AAC.1
MENPGCNVLPLLKIQIAYICYPNRLCCVLLSTWYATLLPPSPRQLHVHAVPCIDASKSRQH